MGGLAWVGGRGSGRASSESKEGDRRPELVLRGHAGVQDVQDVSREGLAWLGLGSGLPVMPG